jgi:cysteine-rich repeat protein
MRAGAWLAGGAVFFLGFWACSGEESATTPSTTTGTTSTAGSGGGGAGGSGGTGGGGGAEPAECGNGVQEQGEECDDGNATDGDGCEADCTLPACGNGIVDPGEVCWGGSWAVYPVRADVPRFLLVTDCDSDGDLDVLSIGESAEAGGPAIVISALTNDGAGILGAELVSGVVGSDPRGVALGDLDGAAGLDLVVAMAGGSPRLRTTLGQDDCTFVAANTLMLPSAPRDVAAWRLDADALDDFVAPVSAWTPPSQPTVPPQLAYHLSPEAPTSIQTTNASAGNPTAIVFGLVNGNGSPGVVYTDQDANQVVVRSITDGGPFGPAVMVPVTGTTGAGPAAVALGDVDGNGEPDILTANVDADSISVLLNDGSSFTLGGVDASVVGDGPVHGHRPSSITLADVDQDGDLDVLTTNLGDPGDVEPTPSMTLLLNDGIGTFAMATSTLFPLVETSFPIALDGVPGEVAAVDLNGDGALDLITEIGAADPNDSAVLVLLANP